MKNVRSYLTLLAFAGAALSGPAMAEALKLSGAQEVPPVQTTAEGAGEIDLVAVEGA